MKSCVQWNLVYCWKDYRLQRVSNLRLLGHCLTTGATISEDLSHPRLQTVQKFIKVVSLCKNGGEPTHFEDYMHMQTRHAQKCLHTA